MNDFVIRFLTCNLLFSAIVGILLLIKYLFRNFLSPRMQYNIWFLWIGLLVIPFFPIPTFWELPYFSFLLGLKNTMIPRFEMLLNQTIPSKQTTIANWNQDFTLSLNRGTLFNTNLVLGGIWIMGILLMMILLAKSFYLLTTLKKTALPLQNSEIQTLYQECLQELHLEKKIPIYSTCFLKSPALIGLFHPSIYLPNHLLLDYHPIEVRYMLLHELHHYKSKDAISNTLMNLIRVFYWFNPFVWYALKEMRSDREIACDTSVLSMLKEEYYFDYGNTLINFVEKLATSPFPFATGLSGTMKQMKRRIANIASYKVPSFQKKIISLTAFLITSSLILGFVPIVSIYASDKQKYQWATASKNLSYRDFSSYFNGFEGSFVLYDLEHDSWMLSDLTHATTRVSPNSTYKIYDALFGLDANLITPKDSSLTWDHTIYPFEAWNADQTLPSAMNASVNWYFQELDQQLGATTINSYLQEIGYGNQDISGDFPSYWLESSLKISPIEQVNLLVELYTGNIGFTSENRNAVKDSIRISSSEYGTFYGKTGTGRVNEQDINGWFIGYIETNTTTYFFATNIQNPQGATGSKASEISRSILSDMNIWKS